MKPKWYRSKIVMLVGAGAAVLLMVLYMYYSAAPSPCECARLNESAPWTEDYNPFEGKSGNMLENEVSDELFKKGEAYFELSKQCALEYGSWEKDDMEKGLSEATGMYRWQKLSQILIFSRTIENAEGECEPARP